MVGGRHALGPCGEAGIGCHGDGLEVSAHEPGGHRERRHASRTFNFSARFSPTAGGVALVAAPYLASNLQDIGLTNV